MKMNLCILYIGAWCVYNLQGILYPEGGILSLTCLSFCIAISLSFFIRILKNGGMPPFLKGISRFLIVLTVYGLVDIVVGTPTFIAPTTYVKTLWMSLLPVFPLYYFTIRGDLTLGVLRKFLAIFAIIVMLNYGKQFVALQTQLIEDGSIYGEGNLNVGYLFLSLFPGVFLLSKNTILRLCYSLFVFIFVLLSMKRGAMAVGAVCMFFFVFKLIRGSTGKTMFVTLFSVGVLLGVVYWLFSYKMATSDYFIMRLEGTLSGEDSSGRNVLFDLYFNHFLDNSFFAQIFGEGANATVRIGGLYAHNDWLELLTNQGLLGIFLYVQYWLSFFRNINLEKVKNNYVAADILEFSFIIYFITTFFSMSYGAISVYANTFVAFALGYRKQQQCLKFQQG